MLNILAPHHRKRALAVADHVLALPASAPLDITRDLATRFPGLGANHVRGAMHEAQRRADASAARARAKTGQLVANAIEAAVEWVEAKAREQADTNLAGEIADWLQVGGHARPFWRDSDFIAEFGAVRRVDLAAAVDELHARAAAKAKAAGMPGDWLANLTTEPERNFQ